MKIIDMLEQPTVISRYYPKRRRRVEKKIDLRFIAYILLNMSYNNQPCWDKQSQDYREGLILDIKFNRSVINKYISDYLLGNEFEWDNDFREEQFHTELVAVITNRFNSFDNKQNVITYSFNSFNNKKNMDEFNIKIRELIEEYVEDKYIIGIDNPDSDSDSDTEEEVEKN